MPLVRGAARTQATLADVSQLPCVRRDKETGPTGEESPERKRSPAILEMRDVAQRTVRPAPGAAALG